MFNWGPDCNRNDMGKKTRAQTWFHDSRADQKMATGEGACRSTSDIADRAPMSSTIRERLFWKPRSSSLSASSSTSHCRCATENAVVDSRWSRRRPGVATRITTPFLSRCFSWCRFSPPVNSPGTSQMYRFASSQATAYTCTCSTSAPHECTSTVAVAPPASVRCLIHVT
jgi:hypothetical protein